MNWRNKRKFDFRQSNIYRNVNREKFTLDKKYFWIGGILFLILIVIWFLFYSDTFKIKNIVVDGSINDSIRKEIEKFSGNNIFLFIIGQKERELALRQASIEKLNIIKGIPDTIKIEVLVRDPKIRWKTKDKVYYIDKEGIVFNLESNEERYNELPMIIDKSNLDVILGRKAVTGNFINYIIKSKSELTKELKKEITEISIDKSIMYVDVKFKDSYKVMLDTMSNFDDQLYLLKEIDTKHGKEIKEYVDLRVTKRAYYK